MSGKHRSALRLVALLALPALLAAACTPPVPFATPEPESGRGRLAYVGADGNVYVTAPDLDPPLAVTDDATAPPEGQGRSYHRLSWSPEGWLAFAAVTRSGSRAQGELYVVEAPGEPPRLVAQNDEHFFIYVYWSPVPCPGRPACRCLAYLVEEAAGVGLHLVEIEGAQVRDRLVGIGQPFYFAWSPDGERMAWHTSGSGRDAAEAALRLYDVGRDEVEAVSLRPGAFLAPAWSPDGEAWLGVSFEAASEQLRSFGPEASQVLASAPGEIVFAWSPDGRRIAYAWQRAAGASFYGPIHVYDLLTDSSRQVTDDTVRVRAFFWSPEGGRLAYLTWLDLPRETWSQWRVYDFARDDERGFATFRPSPLMEFSLHSFNQYAQSLRFWSSGGRYLAYAERDSRTGRDRVWLVDTWAAGDADPIRVDAGSMAYWSFD